MGDGMRWERLADRALAGEVLDRSEARAVLHAREEELLSLTAAASRVRRAYFGNQVKLNFLLNIKSGLCPEDCGYCSQSAVSRADIARYPLLPQQEILAAAQRAVALKAARFCMVASGRGPSEREVGQVGEAVVDLRSTFPRLELCCCLGLLKDRQATLLKGAGVLAYNHNLNTSEGFYPAICSTHTYRDRLETVRRAKAAGLSACSGVLFGLGEGQEEVLDLAYALRGVEVDSIPINFLIPIGQTPLAGRPLLGPSQCLQILSLFRFLHPDKEIRIAGGREVQLGWLQPLGLQVANSIFIGDYLTTKGQPPEADFAMIRDLGFAIVGDGVAGESC